MGPAGPQGPAGAAGAAGVAGEKGADGHPGGYGLIPDPHFERNLEKWLITPDTAGALKNTALLDAPPPGGINVVENVATQSPLVESTELVPYNPQLTYEVAGMFKQADATGSAGAVTLGVRFYAADRTFIEWHKAADMVAPGTNWTRYSGKFGAGTAVAGPANAQYMTVGALLNIDAGEVPGNRLYQVSGLSITRSEPPPVLPASGAVALYGFTTTLDAYVTLDSFTVSVPGPGRLTVLLTASFNVYGCDSAAASSRMCSGALYLCDAAATWCGDSTPWIYEDPDNASFANEYFTRTIARTVNVTAAGTRQFHVNVYTSDGSIELTSGSSATIIFTPAALTVTSP